MPQIVATGSITITDQNDAKTLVAFITANGPLQQVYNPDTSPAYVPDRTSSNLTLTARVYAGNAEVTAELTSRGWSNTFNGADLGTGTSLVVNTNMGPTDTARTYFFKGTYTDPATGLQSFISAEVATSVVRTGTNATYVEIGGIDVIVPSNTNNKNNAYLVATLRRGSTDDTAVTRYKWSKLVGGTYQLIHAANAALSVSEVNPISGATTNFTAAQLYGFKTQADYAASPNTEAAIGANVQANATDDAVLRRAITINERAVDEIGLFKVEIVDGSDTYTANFTVYDVSDPYGLQIFLTNGDKLLNGQGSTDAIPRVFQGDTRITDLTGWQFIWSARDRDGRACAFIDEAKTGTASGLPITSNTTTALTLNTGSAAISANLLAAGGQFIKVVKGSVARYYETASVTGNTGTTPVVTLKAAPTAGTIDTYTAPTANEFSGGSLFICERVPVTNGGATETAAKLTITEWEVDGKLTPFCEAVRP